MQAVETSSMPCPNASFRHARQGPLCLALPVARHSMMSKRNMRLITNILHNNVIWYREVSLKVHCVLCCHILCTQQEDFFIACDKYLQYLMVSTKDSKASLVRLASCRKAWRSAIPGET